MRVRAVAFVATWAASMAATRGAAAVEREQHAGLDLGGAMLMVSDKGSPDFGARVGAHWAYGLSDAFNLMVEGGWSLVALGEGVQNANTPRTRPSHVTDIGVGLGYVFDVLRWVPYVGVLANGYALAGGTLGGVKILPGLAVAGGLDYRLGRSWAVGVALRWHFLVTDESTYPSFTTVLGRCEYTWGW